MRLWNVNVCVTAEVHVPSPQRATRYKLLTCLSVPGTSSRPLVSSLCNHVLRVDGSITIAPSKKKESRSRPPAAVPNLSPTSPQLPMLTHSRFHNGQPNRSDPHAPADVVRPLGTSPRCSVNSRRPPWPIERSCPSRSSNASLAIWEAVRGTSSTSISFHESSVNSNGASKKASRGGDALEARRLKHVYRMACSGPEEGIRRRIDVQISG